MKGILKKFNKTLVIVVAALILVLASIGGTLAWLTSTPQGLTNTFVPGKVDTTVNEDFKNGDLAKENVYIKNGPDANVPAFIRVALVPVWRNADNTGTGLAADTVDVTGQMGEGWFYEDGYYYFSSPVAPNEATDTALITSIKAPPPPTNAPADVYYELQVVAQSIQAEGLDGSQTPPATLAWGITIEDGKMVPKNP